MKFILDVRHTTSKELIWAGLTRVQQVAHSYFPSAELFPHGFVPVLSTSPLALWSNFKFTDDLIICQKIMVNDLDCNGIIINPFIHHIKQETLVPYGIDPTNFLCFSALQFSSIFVQGYTDIRCCQTRKIQLNEGNFEITSETTHMTLKVHLQNKKIGYRPVKKMYDPRAGKRLRFGLVSSILRQLA